MGYKHNPTQESWSQVMKTEHWTSQSELVPYALSNASEFIKVGLVMFLLYCILIADLSPFHILLDSFTAQFILML